MGESWGEWIACRVEEEVKIALNLGSGQRPFKSTPEVRWSNIDKIARGNQTVDLLADGACLPHIEGTVDYVVLHHVLEHFGCNEGIGLVQEAHRVLKPGGSLLVFLPNMRALATRWLTGELDTQLFMTNVYGAYMGDEADRHKWGFDPDALSEFLWSSAKWSGMGPFDWRPIPGMDAAKDWWIMAAECIR